MKMRLSSVILRYKDIKNIQLYNKIGIILYSILFFPLTVLDYGVFVLSFSFIYLLFSQVVFTNGKWISIMLFLPFALWFIIILGLGFLGLNY